MLRSFVVLFMVLVLALEQCPVWSVSADTHATSIVEGLSGDWEMDSYATYRKNHADAACPDAEIVLDADKSPVLADGAEQSLMVDYKGENGTSIYLSETADILWTFEVEAEGLYNLQFRYYPVEGGGNAIERRLLLDGEVPFREAGALSLDRVWTNSQLEAPYDQAGNEVLPTQIENPAWVTQYAEDPAGLSDGPLCFFLSAGTHTVTLSALKEPLLLRRMAFVPVSKVEVPSYADLNAQYKGLGHQPVADSAAITLQGEHADRKSSQMLYPLADRTSPTVSQYDSAKIRYNTIGGTQWSFAGQWIEWDCHISESGLYALGAHFKQNFKDGVSIRKLTVDGEAPFSEADNWTFPYNGVWQTSWFEDPEGNPYEVYLEEGEHTIRLQVGMGRYSSFMAQAQELLLGLNDIYRAIMVVVGTSPDEYRDYHFDQMIPDTIEDMKSMSVELKKLEKAVLALEGGETIASVRQVYDQLDLMTEDVDTIAARLNQFKTDTAAYGTWMNGLMSQPLELDWLLLAPKSTVLPKGEAGFFGTLIHYIKQFISSFFMDYSALGKTANDTYESITVWMTSGRDQAQILRQRIASDFTAKNGIGADLQLVSAAALLPAALAGRGPDVSLGMTQENAMNLAFRGALLDLTRFEELSNTSNEFYEHSLIPFQFEGGVYGLPETQTYPMLFYRKDILKKLDVSLDVLDRWDTILGVLLPKLQKNSLSIGIMPTIQNYLSFCYQHGGAMYEQDGRMSGLSSNEAIAGMEIFTTLYTQYGLPLSFDFANRFRTGELPVAIVDFTQYNLLHMFAPEIKGLWGMLPIPGTLQADGTVSHAAVNTVTGSVILSQSQKPDTAWKFLQWWVSAETQAAFGKELEAVVGSAARYNTANKYAMKQIQWDAEVLVNLIKQAEELKAYTEVPGGYFTARHFNFAFRDVAYDGKDVRNSMNNAATGINRELLNKRREYGLD